MRKIKANRASQALQPTPERSAMRIMRLNVPRSLTLAVSKLFSMSLSSLFESRTSSPIFSVICDYHLPSHHKKVGKRQLVSTMILMTTKKKPLQINTNTVIF